MDKALLIYEDLLLNDVPQDDAMAVVVFGP